MIINREDLAWAAGLFEGEGCFSFSASNTPKRSRRSIHAAIHMTDLDVLQKFLVVVQVGAVIGPQKSLKPNGQLGKPCWTWSVGSFEGVQAVMCMLWPWLHIRRREKIKLVLTRYHKSEPSSHRMSLDRTAGIRAALLSIDAPIWGRRWLSGMTQKEIAKQFNVSTGTVSNIKHKLEHGGGALRLSQK